MIDSTILTEYAKKHKIDRFTVLREYLQIVFLNALYKLSKNNRLVFKGGTAIRLVYGSPRFSEDLDFNSTMQKIELRELIGEATIESEKSLPGLSFNEIKSIKGYSAKIYLPTKIAPMPLTIKLDFSEREETIQKYEGTIATELPVQGYSLIVVMSEKEILAEKFRTLFQRDKGRDIYDIWYLLNKKVPVDPKLISAKFKLIDRKYSSDEVVTRIATFNKSILERDLFKFLPTDQRSIVKKLLEIIIDRLKAS